MTNPEKGESALEVHDRLAAREIVLLDEENNPTAVITGAGDELTGLHVWLGKGEDTSVMVGIESATGAPSISVRHRGGVLTIAVTNDGRTAIDMTDADGQELVIDTHASG